MVKGVDESGHRVLTSRVTVRAVRVCWVFALGRDDPAKKTTRHDLTFTGP